MLHAQREQVTRDYARILANDLFSADVILEAILNGPSSELTVRRDREGHLAAIDAEAGLAKPLLTLTIGTKRYTDAERHRGAMVVDRLPEAMVEAKDYAAKSLRRGELRSPRR